MKKHMQIFLGSIFVCLAFVYIWLPTHHRHKDPDRFYHFFISKVGAEEGVFALKLPQSIVLPWRERLAEKEWIFHVVTSLGYLLKGEQGVEWAAMGIALSVFFLLAWRSQRQAGVFWGCLLAFVILVGNVTFSLRMTMLRPQVLGVLALLLFAFALERRNKWWVLVASSFFMLSYHAFYLPLVILAAWVVNAIWQKRTSDVWRISFATTAGLLIGILANPYFPGSWQSIWTMFQVAIGSNHFPAMPSPWEFKPFPLLVYAQRMAPALLGAIIFLYYFREKRPPIFWFIAAMIFWALAAKNSRAMEYAVPFTLLFWLDVQSLLSTRYRAIAISSMLILVLIYGTAERASALNRGDIVSVGQQEDFSAILSLPRDAKRVYHCAWSLSPYLLQLRPDIEFLEILDPAFFFSSNPSLYMLRDALNAGRVLDPGRALREAFSADHVICEEPGLIEQMERSPEFRELYRARHTNVRTFAVGPKDPGFVEDFTLVGRVSVPRARFSNEGELEYTPMTQKLAGRSIDLSPEKRDYEQVYCSLVLPRVESKPDVIGLGGGKLLRMELNGKKYFLMTEFAEKFRPISVWIPVNEPIRSLRIEVCASGSSGLNGLSVYLGNKKQLAEKCADSSSLWDSQYPLKLCGIPLVSPVSR